MLFNYVCVFNVSSVISMIKTIDIKRIKVINATYKFILRISCKIIY